MMRALAFLLFLASCATDSSQIAVKEAPSDSVLSHVDSAESGRLMKRREVQDIALHAKRSDILNRALSIARDRWQKGSFREEFIAFDSNLGNVTTQVGWGYLFHNRERHLIVKQHVSGGPEVVGTLFFDFFTHRDEDFVPLLSREQWDMEYVNDTVQDINGDGYNDFVVNTYGVNGCCMKAFSSVYLFQPLKGTFTEEFEFINPTFSPKEKVIRGMSYGHPGETDLYKYRWKDWGIDTVEFVYHDKENKGYIVDRGNSFSHKNRIRKRVKQVPHEYQTIYGYDWFTGEGFE